MGEACRRKVHHDVAVYVLGNVPEDHLEQVKHMLFTEPTRINGGNPLTTAQALRRIRGILGRTCRSRTCPNCLRLEEILRSNGISPFADAAE
jgi:hypothetical protein